MTSGFAAITGVTITTGAIVRAKYQQETPNAEAHPAPSTNIQDFFSALAPSLIAFLPKIVAVIRKPNNKEKLVATIGDAKSVAIFFASTAMAP